MKATAPAVNRDEKQSLVHKRLRVYTFWKTKDAGELPSSVTQKSSMSYQKADSTNFKPTCDYYKFLIVMKFLKCLQLYFLSDH